MEVPMLDEDEFRIAFKLYRDRIRILTSEEKDQPDPLLVYYNNLTGFGETNPNAIMHHRISHYGPPCENCGKPYRTPAAKFCAACGNQRESSENTDER